VCGIPPDDKLSAEEQSQQEQKKKLAFPATSTINTLWWLRTFFIEPFGLTKTKKPKRQLRDQIAEANLRLVVSIAKKYYQPQWDDITLVVMKLKLA
jgi:DNA-directed RNA polymerase sigma subunit (sigma70/sigma32)